MMSLFLDRSSIPRCNFKEVLKYGFSGIYFVSFRGTRVTPCVFSTASDVLWAASKPRQDVEACWAKAVHAAEVGGWNMVKLGNLKTWMALDGWIPRKIITRNQTWQWTPPIYRWCSHWNLHLYWMFHCHVWLPEGKQLHVGGSSMLIHTTFGTRGHDRSLWSTWMSKVQSSMANGCLGLLGSHHIWWRTIFIIYKSIKSIYLAITPSSCLSI